MTAYTIAYQDDQRNSFEEQFIFGTSYVDPKMFAGRLGKKAVVVWKYLQRLQEKGSTSKTIHYVWCSIKGTAKKLGMTHGEVAWAFKKLKHFDLIKPAPADLENELYIGWREHGDHDVYYRRIFGKPTTIFDSDRNRNQHTFRVPKSTEAKLREKSNHGGTRRGAGSKLTMLGRIEALKNLPQFADRKNLLIYFLKNFPDQDSDENRAAIFSERPPMQTPKIETFDPSPNDFKDINSTNFGQKTYNTICEPNPNQEDTGSESTTHRRTDCKENRIVSTTLLSESSIAAVANVAAALAFVTTKNLNDPSTSFIRPTQVASQPSQPVGEAAPQTNSRDKKANAGENQDLNENLNLNLVENLNEDQNEDQNEDLVQIQSIDNDKTKTFVCTRPIRVASQPSQSVGEAAPHSRSRSQSRDKVDDVSETKTTSRQKASAPRSREFLSDGRIDFAALAPIPQSWPKLPASDSLPEMWPISETISHPIQFPAALSVFLPPPPKLPGDRDSDFDAEIVMSAYRAVSTRHTGKQSLVLTKAGTFRKSKFYRMALNLASVLRRHDLAPMVWFEWSFGKWRGDSQPPLNFLLSDVRVEKYFDWCEREMGALLMPRQILIPTFDALTRRCWALNQVFPLVDVNQRTSVIEFFFPNHLFEEMLHQAKKDEEKIRETIKSYIVAGNDWIWG